MWPWDKRRLRLNKTSVSSADTPGFLLWFHFYADAGKTRRARTKDRVFCRLSFLHRPQNTFIIQKGAELISDLSFNDCFFFYFISNFWTQKFPQITTPETVFLNVKNVKKIYKIYIFHQISCICAFKSCIFLVFDIFIFLPLFIPKKVNRLCLYNCTL